MRIPDIFLSQESRAERNKREKIADLNAQRNELLRQRATALEIKAQIEAWPGDRGRGGVSSERREDAVTIADLDQKIGVIEAEIARLEAEVTGIE